MVEFAYQDLLPLGPDTTAYRQLSTDYVKTVPSAHGEMIEVAPEALTLLADQAFRDISHLLRPAHLNLVKKIFEDPQASANDRFVALEMLKNAVISAEKVFPMCQDTGTAVIMGKKGQQVWTGCRR